MPWVLATSDTWTWGPPRLWWTRSPPMPVWVDIEARMDCTCGCDKKVQIRTCNASTNIKHALVTEGIDGKSDAEVMKSLNKRFCVEVM